MSLEMGNCTLLVVSLFRAGIRKVIVVRLEGASKLISRLKLGIDRLLLSFILGRMKCNRHCVFFVRLQKQRIISVIQESESWYQYVLNKVCVVFTEVIGGIALVEMKFGFAPCIAANVTASLKLWR